MYLQSYYDDNLGRSKCYMLSVRTDLSYSIAALANKIANIACQYHQGSKSVTNQNLLFIHPNFLYLPASARVAP